MSPKEGMDPQVVRDLAGHLDRQAEHLTSVIAKVNGVVANLEHVWRGHAATQFKGWWETQHRPHLTHVRDAVHGLATSARNNAAEQDRASSAGGGGSRFRAGPIGLPGRISGPVKWGWKSAPWPIVPVRSPSEGWFHHEHEVLRSFREKWGWSLGPVVGKAADHIKPGWFGLLTTGDQVFRLGQDIWSGHYAPHSGGALTGHGGNAFDQAFDTLGSIAGKFGKTPVGAAFDVDLRLYQGVGDAASQVDWSWKGLHDTLSGMFDPGAWNDVGKSEWSGFKQIGKNIWSDTFGAFF